MFRLLHGPLQQTGAQESDSGLVPSRVLQGGNTTCDQSQKSKSPTSAPRTPNNLRLRLINYNFSSLLSVLDSMSFDLILK